MKLAKNIITNAISAPLRWTLLTLCMVVLQSCGGGESTQVNPPSGDSGNANVSQYNGPNALTDEIRAFQTNVWEPLRASNRCGACHIENGQSPSFVRMDDINAAYAAVTALVDLDNPAASRLATKVGTGHNCWLTSNAACETRVASFIEDWANGLSSGSGRQIPLVAPAQAPPGETLTFPSPPDSSDYANFDATWTLLKDNCSGCHVEDAANKQAPFFASPVVADAFEAAKSKIDLNNPSNSRLVLRLGKEFHNCWSDCTANANEMQAAILGFANTLTAATVEAPLIFSNAVRLVDGVVAAGGNRYESNVIALYEFKTGEGNVALDTSNVGTELNMTLSGSYNWVGGWGIEIIDGKAQGSTSASKKLHDLIKATGEYSIEAWVTPANVTQEGPARIITYSGGDNTRNFTLGQTLYNYNFLQRSSTTDGNGEPALSTDDDDEDLQASLQHVVVNFDPVNGRSIYVNGEFTDDLDPAMPGNLNDWDDSFALVFGNETSNQQLWQGVIRMVAIHNRALTPAQIQQNFAVGVGEKFFLLFGISDRIGLADSYIMFEVSQYDSYSYLFDRPTFVNLNASAAPSGIALKGMRIGINGTESVTGQAYSNLDLTLGGTLYSPDTGQLLATVGTLIPLENGPEVDEFFLTFEVLGGNTNAFSETTNLVPPAAPGPGSTADIGLRTFDEINATMASLTGVSVADSNVFNTFTTVRQQLPPAETFESFVSAHQVGIAQLAIAYCDALVESGSLRNSFFTQAVNSAAFDFNANVYDAFNGGKQSDIATDLYNRLVGIPGSGSSDLTSAPTRAEVLLELVNPADGNGDGSGDGLYDRLRLTCPTSPPMPAACDATRTRTMIKALCASVLGSATMLVQ